MNDFKLTVEKTFDVPADMVYDAWLDPEMVKQFMKPADIVSVPNPIINPKVGGKFQFDMHADENIIPHLGEYKNLNRAKLIAFTWNSMNTKNEDSLVTIKIDVIDENKCKLSLTHEMLPTEESMNDHKKGWTNILEHLTKITHR